MWLNNVQQEVDYESLTKWKEQFESERQEQYVKVRKLQIDTQKRRKAMEMRIKMEQAKEEKRRRDTLSERRAQHIEATMRFQKGIKNFKVDKEKISLEDALKSIEPNLKRISSAEDRYYTAHSPVMNTSSNNNNTSFTNKQMQRAHSSRARLQKSSSFDNIKYQQTNLNKTDDAISQIMNKFDEFKSNYTKSTATPQSTQITQQQQQQQQQQQAYSTTINDENKFKTMLNQNQKTIENYNKEALNDFKNLVFNEIHTPIQIQTPTFDTSSHNLNSNTYPAAQTQNKLNLNLKLNDKNGNSDDAEDYITKNKNENLVNYVNEMLKANTKFNEDVGKLDVFHMNVNGNERDDNSSTSTEDLNIDDSLEVQNQTQKKYQDQSSSTTVSKYDTVSIMNEEKPAHTNNTTKQVQNHFVATPPAAPSRKTFFAYSNKDDSEQQSPAKAVAKTTTFNITPEQQERQQQQQPQSVIKSILKRSKSDNFVNYVNVNPFIRHNYSNLTQHVPQANSNVTINGHSVKIDAKDSIDVTNTRFQQNNSKKMNNQANENLKKKSVRFAYFDDNTLIEESNGNFTSNDNITENSKAKNTKPANGKKSNNIQNNRFLNPGNIFKILDSNIKQEEITDSKPPLPTTQDHSYSAINQKRRELSAKTAKQTPKSPHDILTSPNITSEISSPHQIIVKIPHNTTVDNIQQVQNMIKMEHNTSTPDPQKAFGKNEAPLNTFNNKYGHTELNDPKKYFFTKFNFSTLHETANNNSNNDSLNNTDTTANETNDPIKDYRKYQIINQRNLAQKSPVNTNIVQIQQLQIQQNSAFRPYSANNPIQTVQTNNGTSPSFMNQNNGNNMNGVIYQQAHHSPKINAKFIPPRVLSADYINPQFKFKKYINSPNPLLQFKIQYPLQEELTKQQHRNSTGGFEKMTLSMAQFLKAEELANAPSLSESKILNNLDIMENHMDPRKMPSKISLEEQQIKNSLLRLNEKLNVLNRKPSTGILRY